MSFTIICPPLAQRLLIGLVSAINRSFSVLSLLFWRVSATPAGHVFFLSYEIFSIWIQLAFLFFSCAAFLHFLRSGFFFYDPLSISWFGEIVALLTMRKICFYLVCFATVHAASKLSLKFFIRLDRKHSGVRQVGIISQLGGGAQSPRGFSRSLLASTG